MKDNHNMFVDLGARKQQLVLGCLGQPHHEKSVGAPTFLHIQGSKPSISVGYGSHLGPPQHWVHQTKKMILQISTKQILICSSFGCGWNAPQYIGKTSSNSWDLRMVIPPIEDIEDFQKSKFPQLMWFSHFPIQIIQLLGYHGVPPLWNPLPRPIAKGARRPGPPFGSRPAAAVALPLWSGEPRSLGSPRFRCEYSWDLFFQGFSYDHRGKTQVFCRV